MQKFSNPIHYCSTAIGRFLLEWYCCCEGYCCLLAAYRLILPIEWRQENVRVRQALAREEYPRLAPSYRKSRLLEDIWAQLSGLTPYLMDIFATIPRLKTMKDRQRKEIASHLQSKFEQFYRHFTGFISSPLVTEILRTLPSLSITTSKHVNCCPLPSFVPHYFQYPPAGIFYLVVQCLQTWIRFCLYPLLKSELESEQEVIGSDDQDMTFYSLELCRTFAGIEHQFDHNTAAIFPCFAPIILAAVSCPTNVRPWILSKLRHFEEQGQFCNDSIKTSLSVLWNMPEIVIDERLKASLPNNYSGTRVIGEVVEIIEGLGKANLGHEGRNVEDNELEALARLRGIFGLQDE